MAETLNRAGKRWQAKIWTGIVAIILGLLVFLAPRIMADLLVIFGGVFLIVIGAILIVEVLFMEHPGVSKKMYGGLGLLALVVGILAITVPFIFVIATGIFLGAFLIVFGGMEFVMGLSVDIDAGIRLIEIVSGFLGIAVGVIFIVLLLVPLENVITGGFILGLFLVIFGLLRVLHAYRMKCLFGHSGAPAKN